MRFFQFFLSLALGASLLFSSHVFAQAFPTIESDYQKLQYGIWARKQLPGMFSKIFDFPFDFWALMEKQDEINRRMGMLRPEGSPRKLVTLTINDQVTKSIVGAVAFRNFLASLDQVRVRNSDTGALKQSVKNILSTQQTGGSGDLISLLLLTAVPEGDAQRRAQVFRLSWEEKIKIVDQGLPEDMSQTTFNFKRLKLDPRLKKSELIRLAENLRSDEQNLSFFLALLLKPEGDLTLSEYQSYGDEKSVKSLLSPVLADERLAAAGARILSKKVMSEGVHDSTEVAVEVPRLRLVEVPASLGILRSVPGSDCAHNCSFSLADDPAERIFFVLDVQRGVYKGYVQATMVNSDIGQSLYVNSINGMAITYSETKEIIWALHQARHVLNAQKIMTLPDEAHIGGHINYPEVWKAFSEFVRNPHKIRIWSLDPQVRNLVEEYVTYEAEYEKAYNNQTASLIDPYDIPTQFNLTVSEAERAPIKFENLTIRDVFLFALELDDREIHLVKGKRPLSAGERAVKASGFDVAEYQKLRATFLNHDRLPLEQFYDRVTSTLGSYGIEVDKKFMDERGFLFFEGRLLARDSFSPSERTKSLRILSQLLNTFTTQPSEELLLWAQDKEKVAIANESPEVNASLNWITQRDNFAFHTQRMRKLTMLGLKHDYFRQPEITRELIRIMGKFPNTTEGPSALGVLLNIYPNLEEVLARYINDSDPLVRKGVAASLELENVWPQPSRSIQKEKLLEHGCTLEMLLVNAS